MFTRGEDERITFLQGKRDLLISRTLVFPSDNGLGIAPAIKQQSDEVQLLDQGSLHPALQRRKNHCCVKAKRGISTNNRKAQSHEWTKAGRERPMREATQWRKLIFAIGRALGPEKAEG